MKESNVFQVATYNLWGTGYPAHYWRHRSELRGAEADSRFLYETDESRVWQHRREALIRELSAEPLDIIAFQEIPTQEADVRDRAQDLADSLSLRMTGSASAGAGRLAILTAERTESVREMPMKNFEGANGGHPTVLEVETELLRIWCVHGPVGPNHVRAAYIDEIALKIQGARGGKPLIVCGDLNCPDDEAPIQNMLSSGQIRDAWIDAGGGSGLLTMPLPNPKWRLDYILYRQDHGIVPVGDPYLIGQEPDTSGLYPSDHIGISVAFEFSN